MQTQLGNKPQVLGEFSNQPAIPGLFVVENLGLTGFVFLPNFQKFVNHSIIVLFKLVSLNGNRN